MAIIRCLKFYSWKEIAVPPLFLLLFSFRVFVCVFVRAITCSCPVCRCSIFVQLVRPELSTGCWNSTHVFNNNYDSSTLAMTCEILSRNSRRDCHIGGSYTCFHISPYVGGARSEAHWPEGAKKLILVVLSLLHLRRHLERPSSADTLHSVLLTEKQWVLFMFSSYFMLESVIFSKTR
jgi:hypothetical protein